MPKVLIPKVLISDKLSQAAVDIFRNRGIEVDVKPGLTPAELRDIIGSYDGLAIRSNTKVTKELLDVATRLKVVGRAGIGVDNVDLKAATARGVVVMNTPHGNSITTAEHAVAMMFALAREIPGSHRQHQGRQVGEEPVHGCRTHRQNPRPDRRRQYRLHRRQPRAGPAHARRRLRSVSCPKNAPSISAWKSWNWPICWRRADFITLHTPLTDSHAQHSRPHENLAKTKKRRAHHQLRPRRPDRRSGSRRCHHQRPCRRCRTRCLRNRACQIEPALRHGAGRLHAASRRQHQRGAGKRGTPGRRTDQPISC